MTKVKICGITNSEDALLAAKFGADALGFNFYEKSPRYIAPEKAGEIIDKLPPKILKVGVFVNEDLEKIVATARTAKLDALQLHGEETPDFARELKAKTNLEIIRAFRVSPEFVPEDVLKYEVDAILLDAYNPKEHGGTGETFDWKIAEKVQEIRPKMYLAGGLTHENVSRAVSSINSPTFNMLDVCSGIELTRGKKDRIKLINFLSKVKNQSKLLEKYSNTKTPRKHKSLYDFLVSIHARPAMYLGEKSLTKLQIFLFGFMDALHLADANFDVSKYNSEEFRKWMSEKVGYGYPNSIDCMTHILRKFNYDEEKSFDYFFALLEEFKLEREDLGEN